MIYEFQISYNTRNDKGRDVTKKESYIVTNAETFTEVESVANREFDGLDELDIVAIKRSVITEIVNECKYEDDKIFTASLCDIFHADDGTEKELRYTVALFAQDIKKAHDYVNEYLKMGYDMKLKQIKETKFCAILDCNGE